MRLINKSILIVSPEPWNHIFVSKHHYACYLAKKGNQVIFANPPKRRWGLQNTDIINLQVLDYPQFPRGLRMFPNLISKWLFLKKLKQIERFCKQDFDIIWSFDNSVFFDFSSLPTYSISHIVDLNQNFQLAKAAKTANLCLYTSSLIGDKLRKYNLNAHFINHGFNEQSVLKSMKLPGHNRVKVIYAGNLNMPYLDWGTLERAFVENSNVDFVFIGPLEVELIRKSPNHDSFENIYKGDHSYFIGKVNSDELPSYYSSAHILIICYQEKYHHFQSNPHKLMEYLGSGKAIVATYTSSFASIKSPIIEMCNRNIEFAYRLKKCITNLDFYCSPKNRGLRKEIALENTYERQIERIESKIAM